MRYVCEYNKCAGCMACKELCPVGAIRIDDSIKAFNAIIDEDKCINCNLCDRVCQRNNPPEKREPIFWAQGWSKNPDIRNASSSGGFAAELMRAFVKMGGSVCSCIYRDGKFGFEISDDIESIKKYQGSKYVKSNPEGIYKKVKELLRSGRKVLFIGLPCQVGSLLNYVGDNENLYTVDLICHGTPSPKVLESFLKAYKVDINTVHKMSFRSDKGYGVDVDGRRFSINKMSDYYSFYFLECASLTENCYSCHFATDKRISDITIGDNWGSDLANNEKKAGISLALCQSEKGKELLESAELFLFDVDIEKAKQANPQLNNPSKYSVQTDRFLGYIADGMNFKRVARKINPKRYYKFNINKILIRFGLKK